jgi:hypothetical protein
LGERGERCRSEGHDQDHSVSHLSTSEGPVGSACTEARGFDRGSPRSPTADRRQGGHRFVPTAATVPVRAQRRKESGGHFSALRPATSRGSD